MSRLGGGLLQTWLNCRQSEVVRGTVVVVSPKDGPPALLFIMPAKKTTTTTTTKAAPASEHPPQELLADHLNEAQKSAVVTG